MKKPTEQQVNRWARWFSTLGLVALSVWVLVDSGNHNLHRDHFSVWERLYVVALLWACVALGRAWARKDVDE